MPSEQRKQIILVVEDHADTIEMMRLLLEGLDYAVLIARNGCDAVSLASEFKPDLVLTDYGLPDLNGIEVIRRLRSLEGSHQVPIVMLTAYGRREYEESAIAAGCTIVLSKPTDFETIRRIVVDLLAKSDNKESDNSVSPGTRERTS